MKHCAEQQTTKEVRELLTQELTISSTPRLPAQGRGAKITVDMRAIIAKARSIQGCEYQGVWKADD